MENETVTPIAIDNHSLISQADESFFKRFALGGPGINLLISAPDFRITFCNKQCEHYLGITYEEATEGAIYFNSLLESTQTEQFKNQLNRVKNHIGARTQFTWYRIKDKTGNRTGYYLYAAPFYTGQPGDNNSEALFYLTLHPDQSKWEEPFTSSATRELFLQNTEKEKSGTFEWILSADTVVWSDGLLGIYELDLAAEPAKNPFDNNYVYLSDQHKVREELDRSIEHGYDMIIDFKIITPKQTTKVLECLARIIKDEDGTGVTLAGSLRDITRQRMVEDDLKIKMTELSQSNKDLEEFAYIASHDLQEPLRKITTFSDWLGEKYRDVLTGDGTMYLSRMITSAGTMRRLINDLLEFSRIPRTSQPFEPVSLDKILSQVKTELELTIEETGTVIKSELLPTIDAVNIQMKQLFCNIAGNAIKFRKQDVKPVLTFETAVLTDTEKLQYELLPETTYHKIQVTDNGIGFEKEYARQIFQVFQRLHGKSEYPGSGIGLAICKKIVEYHNGIIYAENIEGTGARFVIILPQQRFRQN